MAMPYGYAQQTAVNGLDNAVPDSPHTTVLDRLVNAVSRVQEAADRTRSVRQALCGALPESVQDEQKASGASGLFENIERLSARLHVIADRLGYDMETIDATFIHGSSVMEKPSPSANGRFG